MPISTPLRYSSTLVTATLSVADACTAMVPETVEPLAGEVIAVIGDASSIGLDNNANLPLLAGSWLNIGHSSLAGLAVGISNR